MPIEIHVTREEREKLKELKKKHKGKTPEYYRAAKELFFNREGDILEILGIPDILTLDKGDYHVWEYPESFLEKNKTDGVRSWLSHLFFSQKQFEVGGRKWQAKLITGEIVEYTEASPRKEVEDHKQRFSDSKYLGIGKNEGRRYL